MTREDFIDYIAREENEVAIKAIREKAAHIHNVDCNQKYGEDKPYSFHLDMVTTMVMDYCHLVCEYEHHIIPIIFGAAFHDAIEDARMTYHDVLSLAKTFMTNYQAVMATELVYALTDEKGRTRKERGSDKHYQDIRDTLYAPFVKFCDRYCNWKYSVETGSRMTKVYEKEMPSFIEKIGDTKYVPKELISMI